MMFDVKRSAKRRSAETMRMASCSSLLMLLLAMMMMLEWNTVNASNVKCAYTHRDPVKEMPVITDENDKDNNLATLGELLDDNKTMSCPKRTDFCYALWKEDNKTQPIVMLAQGCWESSGDRTCHKDECISNNKPSKALNTTKFCCCSGNYCNINVTYIYVPTTDEIEPFHPAHPYKDEAGHETQTIIIIVAVIGTTLIIMFVVFIGYRFWRKPHPDSLHLIEAQTLSSTPTCDLTTLKLQEVIGRGRYGAVWKATLSGREVAVKVFQCQHRQYYLNEKDIYTLPHFEHNSLLKFLGAEDRVTPEGRTEYLIVLSFAPFGCLQDYLRSHVIDWSTLCKMSQSVAKGLAHLHVDVRKGDKLKPCISHRDLNSRNILVKNDRSCCICDMGFAMKISGSKYYSRTGEEQCAETTSLTDVGTLRYMAPEVLEGAVNLRDCESSLKQIDVYALGLILWEIMTRCEDLYQGLEAPEYRMPFEAEIGLHPTFEQMQVLISRNKARPLFSEVWKDSNQAIRLLKETVEDCWDQDAEARLTSLCVDERLQELPVLWDRHKANITVTAVSPTVNLMSQVTSLRNPHSASNASVPSNTNNTNIVNTTAILSLMSMGTNELERNTNMSNSLPYDGNLITPSQIRNICNSNRESSTSEATMETTVTMSPSEPSVPTIIPDVGANKNANVNQVLRTNVPLQPYQGRNPCIERNMIMEPLEELSVSGNTLLEKDNKYKESSAPTSNRRDLDIDNIFDVLQLTDNVESNALVSNDVLNHSTRSCNPIPYVQNTIHGSLPIRPKQPNVPGNGQHYDKKSKKGPFGARFEKKKGNQSEQNNKKSSDWGFKSILDRKKGSKKEPVPDTPPVHSKESTVANRNLFHPSSKSNLTKPDKSLQPVPVEVCLLEQNLNDNTHIITRPTCGAYKGIENGYIPNGSCKRAEVGVAHLSPTKLQNGQAPIVKCRSSHCGTNQTNGLMNCLGESDLPNSAVDPKLKRPTTLPLKGDKAEESNCDSCENFQVRQPRTSNDGTNSEKTALLKEQVNPKNTVDDKRMKIVKRVKTPFKMKSGRFSLYDDSMMFQSCLKVPLDGSLQHARECVSMPININTEVSFCPSKNMTQTHASYEDSSNKSNIVNSMRYNGVKPPINGAVLMNGTLPARWINPDCQSRNAESSNESNYQISCL